MKWRWALFIYTWAGVALLVWAVQDAAVQRHFFGTVIVTVALVLWVREFHEGMAWPRRDEWMDP